MKIGWSENCGDRAYKEGVGGSSPSAPTGNVEKPGHFAALEAVGECRCRALSLSFHGEAHMDLGLLEEFRFDWELAGKGSPTVDNFTHDSGVRILDTSKGIGIGNDCDGTFTGRDEEAKSSENYCN